MTARDPALRPTAAQVAHRLRHPDDHTTVRGLVAGRRRPRALTLVAAAALALAVLLAGASLVRTPTVAPSAPATHVVAEGETLWSIAVSTAPAGEAAGYVERLVEATGADEVLASGSTFDRDALAASDAAVAELLG